MQNGASPLRETHRPPPHGSPACFVTILNITYGFYRWRYRPHEAPPCKRPTATCPLPNSPLSQPPFLNHPFSTTLSQPPFLNHPFDDRLVDFGPDRLTQCLTPKLRATLPKQPNRKISPLRQVWWVLMGKSKRLFRCSVRWTTYPDQAISPKTLSWMQGATKPTWIRLDSELRVACFRHCDTSTGLRLTTLCG